MSNALHSTSKSKLHRISALFLAAALVLCCMAGILPASAEETTGSMTLRCVKDEDVVVNMHWQLYRVGHRADSDFVFEGDFADYRVTLGDRTKSMLEWDAETVASVGEALKRKTIADGIGKRDEGYTNSSGAVTFDGLEKGLYLVWGDILVVENKTYIPSAVFFEMDGETADILNAYPKIICRTLSDSDERYSVRKVWENDENQPQNRAVSITVERYRDNRYFDEIELNEENDWTYYWDDTDNHIWFVYEKVIPENYTVAYKENHTQFLIVNTYEGDTAETTTTATVTETTVGTSGTTTVTTKTTTVPPPSTTTDKAPQTGQLWWPVPALAAGGLLCIGVGLTLRKRDDED